MEWSDEARRLHAESFSVRAEEAQKRAEEAQRVYVRETGLERKREEEENVEKEERSEEVKVEQVESRSEETVLVKIDGRVVETKRRVFDRGPQSVWSEQLKGETLSVSVVMSNDTWAIVHEWLNRLVLCVVGWRVEILT